MRDRIREIIRQACAEMDMHIVKGVLARDHVHMFINVPPKLALATVIQRLKGRSSRRIQMEFPDLRTRYWGRRFEQMLCSPRNAWHAIPRTEGHALPASRLATALRVPQGRVDALLADRVDPPVHIRSNGRPRYILADMQHRLQRAASGVETGTPSSDDDTVSGQPAGASGGLFADAAAAVQAARAADSCTGSGKVARRGGRGEDAASCPGHDAFLAHDVNQFVSHHDVETGGRPLDRGLSH